MRIFRLFRSLARRLLRRLEGSDDPELERKYQPNGAVVGPEAAMKLSRRFEGKVAMITGGGSGLGRATAIRLAKEGASVVITGRRENLLEEVCREIEAAGSEAIACHGDVSRDADCRKAVEDAVSRFGRLDVLVNCAGIHGGGTTVVEMDEKDWDRVLDINLKGSFLAAKYAVAEMQKAGAGAVVNVSSICGMRGSNHGVAYQASKGGIVNLTRHMAVAHAPENIRVNCVCPGVYISPITEEWLSDPAIRAEVSRWHPMERIGDVDEIVAAIAFLASEEASFITGTILPVDGGHLASGRGNP